MVMEIPVLTSKHKISTKTFFHLLRLTLKGREPYMYGLTSWKYHTLVQLSQLLSQCNFRPVLWHFWKLEEFLDRLVLMSVLRN